jgi:hypothetical protein
MGSTFRSATLPVQPQQLAAGSLRWRSWPLVDQPTWSWLVPLGIFIAGCFVFWLGGGWFLALVTCAALAIAMWQFVLPVSYEVTSLGLRRLALRRVRLVPWQAIRAYQMRATGVAFFQRADPTAMDMLNCLFVPYPHDEDELLVAVRLYLPHAVELP